MKKTVKIQNAGTNTYINLPKEMREILNMKKGDTLLLEIKGDKIIISK